MIQIIQLSVSSVQMVSDSMEVGSASAAPWVVQVVQKLTAAAVLMAIK